MRLRIAKKADIDAMVEIVGRTFAKQDAKSSKAEITRLMDLFGRHEFFVVAVEKGRIVGLAGVVQSWLDYCIYEIIWLAVSPDFQNKGIGMNLILEIIVRMKRVRGKDKASALLVSTCASKLFARCGFDAYTQFPRSGDSLMIRKME